MMLERFHLPILGHASHVVACPETRRGVVFDPRLDIEAYLDWARANDVELVGAVDTHAHADYVSGISRLVAAGIPAWGTAEGDVQLGYAHTPLRDGDTFDIGSIQVTALHVPGHTPEHMAYLLRPGHGGTPVLLSGGSLLCGDIGRPDVTAFASDGVRDALALALRSLRDRVLPLGDDVIVRPTHVAGTLCAGGLSEELETTVGHERRTNRCLVESARLDSIDADHLPACALEELEVLPPKPAFWAKNRQRNLAGWTPAELPPVVRDLTPKAVAGLGDAGVLVLDVRPGEQFAEAHVPGSIAVGTSAFGVSLAGVLAGEADEVVLVAPDAAAALEAAWNLRRIGLAGPVAVLAGGFPAWVDAGLPTTRVDSLALADLDEDDITVLDVRMPAEWRAGTIPGALCRSGLDVPVTDSPLPVGRIAVVCEGGARSMAVTSWLLAEGHRGVYDVPAGMRGWRDRQPTTA